MVSTVGVPLVYPQIRSSLLYGLHKRHLIFFGGGPGPGSPGPKLNTLGTAPLLSNS